MDKLLLIGAGGHCESCIEVIQQKKKYKIIGILDPYINKDHKYGFKIYNSDKELKKIFKVVNFALITIGLTKRRDITLRNNYFKLLKKIGFKLPTIISSTAYKSNDANIGEGTILFNKTFVNKGVNIGTNCIINTGSIIEHGTFVGNNTHISTGAIVNGSCKIGDNCFVGSGSVIPQNMELKSKSFKSALKLIV